MNVADRFIEPLDAVSDALTQQVARANTLFESELQEEDVPVDSLSKGLGDDIQTRALQRPLGYVALKGTLAAFKTEAPQNFGNWQHINIELRAPQGSLPDKRFRFAVDVGKPHSALVQVAMLDVSASTPAQARALAAWAAAAPPGLHEVGLPLAPDGLDYAALGALQWQLCTGMEVEPLIAPVLRAATALCAFGLFSVAKQDGMPGLHMVHFNQGNLDARFDDVSWRVADGSMRPADGGILALRPGGCTLLLFKFSNQTLPAKPLLRASKPTLRMLADSDAANSMQARIGLLREGAWSSTADANLHLAVLSPRDSLHVARAQAEAIAALPAGCVCGLLLDNPAHNEVRARVPLLRAAIAARGLPAFQVQVDDQLRSRTINLLQAARAEAWRVRLRSAAPTGVEQVLPLQPGGLQINDIDTRAQVLRATGSSPVLGEAVLLLERGAPGDAQVLAVNGVVIDTRANGFDFLISVRAKDAVDPFAQRLQAQLPSWSNPRIAALNELRAGALAQAITLPEAGFRLAALDAAAGVRVVGLAG